MYLYVYVCYSLDGREDKNLILLPDNGTAPMLEASAMF